MNKLAKNVLFGLLIASPILYVSACSYISRSRQMAFDAVAEGDTQEAVARKLISGYVIEKAGGKAFLRYASRACTAPCVERWWIENRMAFDTEAWSVEFGNDGRVLRKVEWSSP
ncbi:hypothetical protein [Rhodanobacter lindaniclasticus]